MIWLTGDTHGHFDRVEAFCREQQTTTDDILIILGDSGFNFGGGERDRFLKTRASQFPITIFSLHGNRENRPQNIPGYVEGSFHGGKILYEPQYPNLLFAVDGEVYRFAGTDCLVVGGAYSTGKGNTGWSRASAGGRTSSPRTRQSGRSKPCSRAAAGRCPSC